MFRLGFMAIVSVVLGCASTVDGVGAAAVCPDGHGLAVESYDEWVTLICESSPGIPDGPGITWDREAGGLLSVLYFEGGEMHGPSRLWHQNGRLRSESEYLRGSNEGELRMYHENGELAVLATYEGNELEGAWVQWRDDGTLHLLRHWHRGQVDGPFIVWHENGKVKTIGAFWQWQKTGRWQFWNDAGGLERTVNEGVWPASAD